MRFPRPALALRMILLAGLTLTLARAVLAAHSEIPPWSLELEKRAQPWCPASCVSEVPFTALYKDHDHVLVFVGVRHVFTQKNSTINAIDAGFRAATPRVLITEGFPVDRTNGTPRRGLSLRAGHRHRRMECRGRGQESPDPSLLVIGIESVGLVEGDFDVKPHVHRPLQFRRNSGCVRHSGLGARLVHRALGCQAAKPSANHDCFESPGHAHASTNRLVTAKPTAKGAVPTSADKFANCPTSHFKVRCRSVPPTCAMLTQGGR